MKKRRRIEITTFRRRTSIVLRDESEAGHVDAEVWRPLCVDPVQQAAENNRDQTQITDPGAAGRFGRSPETDPNDQK